MGVSTHTITQGRNGECGSWCMTCGVKVYDVEKRQWDMLRCGIRLSSGEHHTNAVVRLMTQPDGSIKVEAP